MILKWLTNIWKFGDSNILALKEVNTQVNTVIDWTIKKHY